MKKKEPTLREHMKKIAAIRWKGTTKAERSEHGKMMSKKRWDKEKCDCPVRKGLKWHSHSCVFGDKDEAGTPEE